MFEPGGNTDARVAHSLCHKRFAGVLMSPEEQLEVALHVANVRHKAMAEDKLHFYLELASQGHLFSAEEWMQLRLETKAPSIFNQKGYVLGNGEGI